MKTKILSCIRIGKYVALKIVPVVYAGSCQQYRINGKEYGVVPVYDLPNHIAIETSEPEKAFEGMNVEFVLNDTTKMT